MRRTAVLLGAAALVAGIAPAQQPDSIVVTVRKIGLPEAPGAIPVVYVPTAKDRALRLQKSIEAAHSWYEKQLNVHGPIVLSVLDAEAREKVSDRAVSPHSFPVQGLIVIPAQGIPPADHPEFLEHEPALFHEDGHILAYRLGIVSGNPFVNELAANIFAVAYMAAERPDLNWVLDDWGAGRSRAAVNPPGYAPRYTSLADFDYLYSGVGVANSIWFEQTGLGRLAVFLAKDQSFPAVVEKLQKAFPAAQAKQETLEDINRHLETIRPGFLKAAGSLAGPTTILRIVPSACPEQPKGGGESQVVVRNDLADPLVVTDLKGKELRIPAHSWRTYGIRAGDSLKLPDASCLVARDEPALAVIDKQ